MDRAASAPVTVLAAGALVWREGEDGLEVMLVHRPRYDDWSIPKGKLDRGETAPAAAVREVAEETGVRVRLHRPLPASVYLLPDGRRKIVQYWVGTVRARSGPGPVDTQEVDEVRWLTLEDAERLLTRQSDHLQIDALRRQQETGTLRTAAIIVQRHGAARDRDGWKKGEATRPLRGKGKRQSAELPALLDAFGPSAVVTSPWRRCRATVEPFARSAGIDIVEKPELTEADNAEHPSRTEAVIERIMRAGRGVVVCTHRPVLPTVLETVRAFATRDVALELPHRDPFLQSGESLVLHTTGQGLVVAVERHRPSGR